LSPNQRYGGDIRPLVVDLRGVRALDAQQKTKEAGADYRLD